MEEFKLTRGGLVSFVAVGVVGYIFVMLMKALDARSFLGFIGVPVLVVTVVCTVWLNKKSSKSCSQATEILLGGLMIIGWLVSGFTILSLLGALGSSL